MFIPFPVLLIKEINDEDHGEREKIVIYSIQYTIIYNTVQTHIKNKYILTSHSPNLKEKENETKITESVRAGMVTAAFTSILV